MGLYPPEVAPENSYQLPGVRTGPAIVERREQSVTWHSVDFKTGARGQQLTTQTLGAVSRQIGQSSDLSGFAVRFTDNGAPIPGVEQATLPGRTMLVALNEDEDPVWAGVVLRRRSDGSEWAQLDMATVEAYLDRRYVSDHDFAQTAQGDIIAAIIAADVVPSGPALVVDAQSPTLRDRTYYDDDDKTVWSVIDELAGVEDGPEVTVDLEWSDDTRTVLNRIVRVRDRIGVSPVSPVILEMPGPVTEFEFIEDYTSDNGANDVLATSSGEGDARPESTHAVATDLIAGGWVKYEKRFTPSTSITEQDTLDAHAQAELALSRDGLTQLSLSVDLDRGPRFGVDFGLGDDLRVVLTCARFPEQIGPDLDIVPGYTKTMRCLAVEIDYDERKMTPTLVEVD